MLGEDTRTSAQAKCLKHSVYLYSQLKWHPSLVTQTPDMSRMACQLAGMNMVGHISDDNTVYVEPKQIDLAAVNEHGQTLKRT